MLTLSTILVILLVGLVVMWCWLNWKHHRLIRAVKKMEGILPIRFPIFGHIPYTLLGIEKFSDWLLKCGMEILSGTSHNAALWIGPFPLPIIGGGKNVQKLLNSSCTSEKADEMRYANRFLGQGLLSAPGDIWKIKRRHMNSLFHPQNLELMMPTFNQNSKELVKNLSNHVGKGPFDVMDHVMDTSLKTICHLIFGPDLEFDMSSQSFKGLKRVVGRIPEIFISQILRVWLRFDVIFKFIYRKELDEINKLWLKFTETPLQIAKAKQNYKHQLKKSIGNGNENDFPQCSTDENLEPLNLLDVHDALEERFPQFDETDLKYEMMTLYTTGTDTMGVAVSSCLLLLAQHQDIQEKLYQEIATNENSDRDVTMEDIQKYTYLDQVYKETLRWSILVPVVARKTSKDLTLGDVTIPAGYTVVVGIAASHMDPKIFPNPQSFDPERFSSRNIADRETNTFLPFSGGPRNCIGQHYTNMLMKVMLVHILRRYKISTDMDVHNMRRKMVITFISVEGYQIMLENRDEHQ